MIAYPFDRRTGGDRRSGKDRRQTDAGIVSTAQQAGRREFFEEPEDQGETRKGLAEVWNHKGEDLLARREYGEAKHAFAKAVEIKPEFALGWYNLAKVHSQEGEKDQAMTNLKKAIKLEPDYREKAKTESLFKKFKGEKDFDKLVR
jgi:tetratricopeptide (TPR) repeat protein